MSENGEEIKIETTQEATQNTEPKRTRLPEASEEDMIRSEALRDVSKVYKPSKNFERHVDERKEEIKKQLSKASPERHEIGLDAQIVYNGGLNEDDSESNS